MELPMILWWKCKYTVSLNMNMMFSLYNEYDVFSISHLLFRSEANMQGNFDPAYHHESSSQLSRDLSGWQQEESEPTMEVSELTVDWPES